MAKYKITGPDGQSYEVNAPDDASQEDVLAYAQRSFKMAKAPAPAAPEKGFGAQLNDLISDAPTQLGLGARGILKGLGNAADFVTSPVRGALNKAIASTQADVNRFRAPADRDPLFQFAPISGDRLADDIGLPKPRNSGERIAGDAVGALAGGVLPIGLGAQLASRATGAAQGVGRALMANPVSQLTSAAAGGAAGSYTRETGGDERSQLLASLAGGIAAPLAMAGGQRLVQGAARSVAGRAAPTAMQIDVTINNALQDSGVNLSSLPSEVAAGLRKDVADAFKISDNLSPDAVRRLADYRLTGATPTRAGLTMDVADITRQRNLAKLGANSQDPAAQALARAQNENNMQLTNKLNELGASTADDQISGAQKIMGGLKSRDDRIKALINQSYDAARSTTGRSAALDPEAFAGRANQLLDENLLGGKVPSDVRNLLDKKWTNVISDGQPAAEGAAAAPSAGLTVDTAEQIKTRLAALQRSSTDPAERKALGLVRSALDDTPLLPGQEIGQDSIDAFNQARNLNRKWMGIVEKTPALQAVRDGAEPDKFVEQFIVGRGKDASVMDVAKLKSSIKNNPEAMGAVKEQIAAYLKSQAKGGAADELANFSQSGYNKALRAIGDRKLNLFFAPDEINQLKALGRVAAYEQVQPAGSAVNNSNTAAGMASLIDRIVSSPLINKIPFGKQVVGDPLQNILISAQAGNALNAPRNLVAPGAAAQGRVPLPPWAVSPNILIPTDEQRQQ